jgi:hypothetical protein
MVYVIQTAFEQQQDQDDDGQRNCPKHIEFHFQNKFEKLVHLVCFIIKKLCHDAQSHVTMRSHMSRCAVTCHDAQSHVTMRSHMNVKFA